MYGSRRHLQHDNASAADPTADGASTCIAASTSVHTRARGMGSAGILGSLGGAGLALLAGLFWAFCPPTLVEAQVRNPGRHPHYTAELEPHLVWQWTGDERAHNDGIGFGFRASIPIIQDGPVTTINNSLAISFGLDWAHFPECYDYAACSEDDFWLPVTAQWNFYLTEVVSIFPEFGLGFRDAVLDYNEPCRGNSCRGNALEVHPVLWFGARFRLAQSFALVMRLGTPSLQLGASFFL